MRYAANAAGMVGAAFRTIMRCLQRQLDARLPVTLQSRLFYHAEKFQSPKLDTISILHPVLDEQFRIGRLHDTQGL